MDQDANILVVDDDVVICNILDRYLTAAGYRVKTAANGEEMYRCIKLQPPDLILLDLKMPGKHGLELARELRKESDMGIIILTGSDETVDKIVGLEVGADDYVPKPFDERELLARVRSVLRRVLQTVDTTDKSVARFSGWTLDLVAHELKSPVGDEVRLTSYEFQLLATLVKSPNRVFNRDQIMESITGRDWIPSDRSIDVLVGKIRKKIEENPHKPIFIKTIRGTGYKFTARVKYS
ncbi:MAG: response regulator transcription factor [Proteobacteria bacterium]|nr:response regulator transcription factor [Pseudomonadota bacterium]